jgi:hypothetical protein
MSVYRNLKGTTCQEEIALYFDFLKNFLPPMSRRSNRVRFAFESIGTFRLALGVGRILFHNTFGEVAHGLAGDAYRK